MYACDNHPLDMAYLMHLRHLPAVILHTYPCKEHNVTRLIRERGELATILTKKDSRKTVFKDIPIRREILKAGLAS